MTQKIAKVLKRKIDVDEAFLKEYENDGVIDPAALAATIENSAITAAPISILAKTYAKDVDHHLTWDIETYATNPSILHFGMVQSLANEKFIPKPLLTWDQTVLFFEDYLSAKSKENPKTNIRVWAHNGAKFDFVGLSNSIESTHQTIEVNQDIEITDDADFVLHKTAELKLCLDAVKNPDIKKSIQQILNDGANGTTKNEFLKAIHLLILANRRATQSDLDSLRRLHGTAATYRQSTTQLAKGVGLNISEIERKRKLPNISPSGRQTQITKKFRWSIKDRGTKSFLHLKMEGGGTISFVDSLWHIAATIKSLGNSFDLPKGITPLKNTHPKKWGKAQNLDFDINDPNNHEKWMAFWHSSITDEDIEYCKRDLQILTTFLKTYAANFANLFDGIPLDKMINPLEYLTSNQAAFSGMIAHVAFTAKGSTQYTTIVKNPKHSHFSIAKDESLDYFLDQNPHAREVSVPLAFTYDDPVVIKHGTFTILQKYQEMWGHVSFGGRTECFIPNTPKGHWSLALDANSMYTSVMTDSSCRLINTNVIKAMSEDILGKDAILEYFEKKQMGGIYWIESFPALNPVIRDCPIFPVKLAAKDYDQHLTFPGWVGKLRTYVTGEELKYFLECTDVENDDIKIVGLKSFHAPLLNFDPLNAFAQKLWALRQAAQDDQNEALSLMYKVLLNVSGFGVFSQINSQTKYLSEKVPDGITTAIKHLMKLSPDWIGWRENEANDLELIKEWCSDHYKSVYEFKDYDDVKWMRVSLPSQTAPHALRPWAYSITANARIKLHKAIVAAEEAGYKVEYSDTDSIHMAIPLDQTEEDVLKNIGDKISIGRNLGQWKVENAEVEQELMVGNADVRIDPVTQKYLINQPRMLCLAPKHYVFYDKNNNVLCIKVKGIRKDKIKMRAGLYQFDLKNSNLGDRRGIKTSIPTYSDIAARIGKGNKRNYINEHKSKPIILEQPESIKKFMMEDSVIEDEQLLTPNYFDYKQTVGQITGDGTGIYQALITYKGLNFGQNKYTTIRSNLLSSYKKLCEFDEKTLEDDYYQLLEEIEGINARNDEHEVD
jgi:hypothetical protein